MLDYKFVKLNNKKNKEVRIDIKKTLNRAISQERNRQLNQFSTIYFSKIKNNLSIYEK